jgi:squalene-hopene/tetraprenyl-beta-curcumene cyclase
MGTEAAATYHPSPQPFNQLSDSSRLCQLTAAVENSVALLMSRQAFDGHWVGELQGDTILESEYILLLAFLGREGEEKSTRIASYILSQQLPNGGWNNYPEGPPDLSVSVKAYFALKLTGHDSQSDYMVRARELIRSLGGAARCNSFTKFYLAFLGQFPYENCPAVPPEMMFLPRWAYFSIYAMSSWTRTIVIPLSIFYAFKPVQNLPADKGIRELFLESPEKPLWPHPPSRWPFTWTNFFLALDYIIKKLGRWEPRWLRARAIERAKTWMLERFSDSDGLGAIFPPMIYTVISLRCLGYADDSEEMKWALRQLENLMIEDGDTIRLQPCFSPVWDTALTLIALADGGVSNESAAVSKGIRWLFDREVRRSGDWSITNPELEPGGWFFEYRNGFYPDTDDTAMVLMALARSKSEIRSTRSEVNPKHEIRNQVPAIERGLRWLLEMQNDDGGWAAFDRNINRELLTKVPFADHNAMLDPSCPDITGRVLEALGHFGYRVDQQAVDRAVAFIEKSQNSDGAWIGRWGVNYIYGTWQVLAGLARIGFDMNHPMVRRAVAWLKSVQQPAGGWGETCRSYDDPTLAGKGTPTASQTAWALLGLIAAGEAQSDEVEAGIDFLLRTQRPDGGWDEEPFTGTGFPKVFYLKYHMYSLYFPLMAMTRYRAKAEIRNPKSETNSKWKIRNRRSARSNAFFGFRILFLFRISDLVPPI